MTECLIIEDKMSENKTSILFQVPTDEYYELLKLKGTKSSSRARSAVDE